MRILVMLVAAFAIVTLSGCGVVGELERPDPVFGEKGTLTTSDATSVNPE